MWLEGRLTRLVEEFWEALPYEQEAFPRDLARSASLALPLAVRELSCLSLNGVKQWLHARGITHNVEGPNRRLRGCLLAYGGHGFVLIDSSDPDDEQRFTVAHELAHFILDYQEPRRKAIETLGEEIIAVLDGFRLPARIEQLQAILNEAPIGLHVNMMERTALGGYTSRATLDAEERADRLALELLAPAADAWAVMMKLPEAQGGSHWALQNRSALVLQEHYGLPEAQARAYANWLLKKGGRRPGAREWLGYD